MTLLALTSSDTFNATQIVLKFDILKGTLKAQKFHKTKCLKGTVTGL